MADAVTITGAIAAGVSAFIAWRVYVNQIAAQQPLLTAEVFPVKSSAGWWRLSVGLTNRSDVEWWVVDAMPLWPRDARLISWHDVPTKYRNAEESLSGLAPAKLPRRAGANLSVARAGTASSRDFAMIMGTQDHHSESFFVWTSRARTRLWIRIRMRSSDAVERRKTIIIKRTLTAQPATVTS